jgi:hypothetical protein
MDDRRGALRAGSLGRARLPPVETVRKLGSEPDTRRRYDDAIHDADDPQQEFADLPADVQEAAAKFPELQAQSGQRKGS